MNSEQNANPTEDEEIIELTDVLKSGPDAEETIIDLTDVVETVKAQPHEPSAALEEDQALELNEDAVTDTDETETLVDLTDALDPIEETAFSEASSTSDDLFDLSEDVSGEAQAMLDLEDALDTPEEEDTILDLDETLIDDAAKADAPEADAPEADASEWSVIDDGDAASEDAAETEETEILPEVLDLAEVLDASEADEDVLALDTPADESTMEDPVAEDNASLLEETLEVIELDPVEDLHMDADASLDDGDLTNLDLDEMGEVAESLGNASEYSDTDESDDILDLSEADELTTTEDTADPVADQATDPLLGADDAGDDLEFKLDEMLAEAQAEMPIIEDDDADMELDLSEALADAAADSAGRESEMILDLNDPVAAPILNAVDADDESADEIDDYDLISDDKIIELDDRVTPEDLSEPIIKPSNVIELADVTGGYPTVSPTTEIDSDVPGEASTMEATDGEEAALTEETSQEEDLLAEADAINETIESDDEDLDLGITLDEDEGAETEEDEDFQLNPEMEELEATLNDVFQDDEGDDPNLSMFADTGTDNATEQPEVVVAEDVAPAADVIAKDLTVDEVTPAATPVPVGDLPAEITEEVLDAAVARVIKTMYADRIEQIVLDVIKEAVSAEIDKVKRSLSD